MNLPKYSLEHTKVVYFFLIIMLIGGTISFFKLPKKEDAPFVIKQAVLITQYPGATASEVEKLITEPIEREIQSMSEVKQIKSESYYGISKISIELKPTIKPERMPVKWDELRRKVLNIRPKLPQGASDITVSDDFGDVYGIYYALTIDEGFSYKELRTAQRIKTELTPIEGVQKGSVVRGTDRGCVCTVFRTQIVCSRARSQPDRPDFTDTEFAGKYGGNQCRELPVKDCGRRYL